MTTTLGRQHRQSQLTLRAATLRDLLKLWPAFEVERIKDTWPSFEAALVTLIRSRGRTSSGLATGYYQELRNATGVIGTATPRIATITTDEIVLGLRAIGPANAGLQLAKGRLVTDVAKTTLVNLSGEVSRHVLDHGRKTLTASLVADQKSNKVRTGVRRVTSGDPCPWCEEQASRTYPPTERFPAHMHCSCFPEVIFSQK